MKTQQPKQKNVFPASFLRKLIDALPTFQYERIEPLEHVFTKDGVSVRVFDSITPDDFEYMKASSVYIGMYPVLGVAFQGASLPDENALESYLCQFYDAADKAYRLSEKKEYADSTGIQETQQQKQKLTVTKLENLYIKAKRKPAKHDCMLSTKLFDTVFDCMQKNIDYVSSNIDGEKIEMVLMDKHDTVLNLRVDIHDFTRSEMTLHGVNCNDMYDNEFGELINDDDYIDRLVAVYEFIKAKDDNLSASIDADYLQHLANRLGIIVSENIESK